MLVQALDTGSPFDAREAASSLGEIGHGACRAIPALIKAVQQHDDADIGWFAAESLGHIAESNNRAVITVLMQATKSSDARMRSSANAGLQALKSGH
jgi:HEAT repeat protein